MECYEVKSNAARVCFSACKQLGRSLRVGVLATDILMHFLIKYQTYQLHRLPNSLLYKKSFTEHLNKHLLLHIMSCIRLASKNILVDEAITLPEIQKVLTEQNRHYSMKSIIKSEYTVFETIDFHVPYRTILDETEDLIEACNSPGIDITELHKKCCTIVKLLYLLNDKIYSKLEWVLGRKIESKDPMNNELDYVLPSALVAAGSILISEDKINIIEKLSEKTEFACSDIEGIANVILLVILE